MTFLKYFGYTVGAAIGSALLGGLFGAAVSMVSPEFVASTFTPPAGASVVRAGRVGRRIVGRPDALHPLRTPCSVAARIRGRCGSRGVEWTSGVGQCFEFAMARETPGTRSAPGIHERRPHGPDSLASLQKCRTPSRPECRPKKACSPLKPH